MKDFNKVATEIITTGNYIQKAKPWPIGANGGHPVRMFLMNVNNNWPGRKKVVTTYLGKPNTLAILRWLKLGDQRDANVATVKIFDRAGLLVGREFGGGYGPVFHVRPGGIPQFRPQARSNAWALYFPFWDSTNFLRIFGDKFYFKTVQGFPFYSPKERLTKVEVEQQKLLLSAAGWKRPNAL